MLIVSTIGQEQNWNNTRNTAAKGRIFVENVAIDKLRDYQKRHRIKKYKVKKNIYDLEGVALNERRVLQKKKKKKKAPLLLLTERSKRRADGRL